VGALDAQIGSGPEGRGRKLRMEVQMRAVGLIHQDKESLLFGRPKEGRKIGSDSIIVRAGEDQGLGLGMAGKG
jgi:hypothetical protein